LAVGQTAAQKKGENMSDFNDLQQAVNQDATNHYDRANLLSGSTIAPPKDVGHVQGQYGLLTEELHRLGEAVDVLRVKLEPVIGPSVPSETAGKGQPEHQLSPLAESLRSDTTRVRDIRLSLDDLYRRIEL
jgi:hypothetical protein